MDIDELLKYIDSEEGTKKKGKKKKKPQQLSKNSKYIEPANDFSSTNVENNLENELEEFKLKLRNDSIKCGQFLKIKPKFSENWIEGLMLK